MAKKLQIIGDFPSDPTIDEEVIEQMVADYLTENPPVAQKITINGEEPDENGNFVINVQGGENGTTNNVVEF